MITISFFKTPIALSVIEAMLIQIQYNIVYYNAFQTKQNLIKESKEQFILVSIHKWMKSNNCHFVEIDFIGNIHLILHQKEFEFHLKNIETGVIATAKFTMK
jgi:hypothetical protein